MARYVFAYDVDLEKPKPQPIQLPKIVTTGDALSVEVQAHIFDNGEAQSVSGIATAYVIRPDGNTALAVGTVNGNTVSAILPATCFSLSGRISIVLKLVEGGATTTVLNCYTTVLKSVEGDIIDTESAAALDIEALFTRLEAATQAATDAADAANEAASEVRSYLDSL